MLAALLVWCAPALAEVPAPEQAAAEGFLAGGGLHGANDLRIRWWRVPEQLVDFEDRRILDYGELVERLDLQGGNRTWTASARVDDVTLFATRYVLDGELVHERELYQAGVHSPFPDAYVALEKFALQRQGQNATWAVGDSYVSFGRGLALNLVKNTDIDIDTSLRGVRGNVRAGDWEVTAVSGGTNPQQVMLENPNLAIAPNDGHAVSGMRVDRFALGPVNVGAHAVAVQFQPDARSGVSAYAQSVGATILGASVEAPGVAGVDMFAEGDVYRYEDDAISVDGGWAAYASASAYPGRAQVLVEARASHNAEYLNARSRGYELAAGPTLEYERVITEDSSAAVNSNDIVGGRARVDVRVGDGERTLLPYVSVAAFRDSDLAGLHFNRAPETILHPTMGVQLVDGELHVLGNGGFRADLRDEGYGVDRLAHADLDVAVPLRGEVSLEWSPSIMVFAWGENLQQQHDYVNASNALALKIGSPWALIAYTDFSDDPLVRSTGNLAENVYGALEAQWMPTPATTVKAFAGAYRAGIRCAGGQCRSLPGFEGVKASVTTAF